MPLTPSRGTCQAQIFLPLMLDGSVEYFVGPTPIITPVPLVYADTPAQLQAKLNAAVIVPGYSFTVLSFSFAGGLDVIITKTTSTAILQIATGNVTGQMATGNFICNIVRNNTIISANEIFVAVTCETVLVNNMKCCQVQAAFYENYNPETALVCSVNSPNSEINNLSRLESMLKKNVNINGTSYDLVGIGDLNGNQFNSIARIKNQSTITGVSSRQSRSEDVQAPRLSNPVVMYRKKQGPRSQDIPTPFAAPLKGGVIQL